MKHRILKKYFLRVFYSILSDEHSTGNLTVGFVRIDRTDEMKQTAGERARGGRKQREQSPEGA
ncbi:MAG: hypothetical protein ACOX4M_07935 [Acetivibrionales bacterium]